MRSISMQCEVGRITLVALLLLGASGCRKGPEVRPGAPTCGNKIVQINPNKGADPVAVYVCDDDTVTWNPNGHTFVVEFKKDSPFKDNEKTFNNGKPKSDKTKHHDVLTVYEYKVIVDGVTFDPQVVAGGGTP